jgi:serine phosphatase RsbU (regulator of sigma subunit)
MTSPGSEPSAPPTTIPRVTRWSASAAGAASGGDWCEMRIVDEDRLVLMIGDVCGHGERATPLMERLRAAVIAAFDETRDPALTLAHANAVAYGLEDGVIVTAIVAVLDRRSRILRFANAGHPPPIYIDANEALVIAQPIGELPLGVYADQRYDEHMFVLDGDALLVLYTDGVVEHTRDVLSGERDLFVACMSAFTSGEDDLAHVIARRILARGFGDDDAAVLALRL